MRNRLTFSSRPAWHCTESYNPTAPLEIPGPSLAHSTTRANGLDCHGDSLPATEAGGDFFAFIPRETSLATSIGSVAGKDSPAAILKAGIQASLTALAGAGVATCANLMEDLNRIVCAVSTGDLFATLFFARIDAAHRRLTYVNAGHEPACSSAVTRAASGCSKPPARCWASPLAPAITRRPSRCNRAMCWWLLLTA